MDSDELFLTFRSSSRYLEARISGYGEAVRQVAEERLRRLIPDLLEGWDGPFRSLREDGLRHLGEAIFETIFEGDSLNIFSSSRPGARSDTSQRLRLRIQVDPTQESQWLSRIPWETMFWRQGDVYLGLDRRFSVVRSLAVPLEPLEWTPSETIRCLAVLGHPGATTISGRPEIDLETESRWIRHGVETSSRLEFQGSVDADPDSLRADLLGNQGQVLHFMGHGFRKRRGERLEFGLLLKDAEGGRKRISADQFADLVMGTNVRLVVLNACCSAQQSSAGDHEPFHGVAQSLIRKGIPAVVALRHPIRDRSARVFSKIFYACLGRGDDLESAVTEARIVMKREVPEVNDWLVPSLFLRSKESLLFPVSANVPSHSEERRNASPQQPSASIRIGRARVSGTMENVAVHREKSGNTSRSLEQILDTVSIEIEDAEAGMMKNVGIRDRIQSDEGS